MVEVTRLAVTVDITGLFVDLVVVDFVQGPSDMLLVTLGLVRVVGGPDVLMAVVLLAVGGLDVLMVVVVVGNLYSSLRFVLHSSA